MVKKNKKVVMPKKNSVKRLTKQVKNMAVKEDLTRMGWALRKAGEMGGGMFGAGDIGRGLGASLSRWLGSGDYNLGRNSLVSQYANTGQVPAMHSSGQSVVVRHKEYIADIDGSINFSVQASYALNPGLSTTFPWLSTIAGQYQEYTWKGIVFHYVPTSGDIVSGTNPAIGSVMLATQYRSSQSAFNNKQQFLNEYFSSDAKPSVEFCHPIECDPKENPFNVQYVRTGAIPAGEDIKTYDLGVTSIATQGMPANGNIVGELWATYEVELRKPIPIGSVGASLYSAHYQGTLVTNAAWLGIARTLVSVDTIGLSFTNNTITFPASFVGRYYVTLWFAGSLTFSQPGAAFTNGTTVATFAGGNTTQFATTNTSAAGGPCFNLIVQCNPSLSNQTVITYSGGTLTGATTVDIIVTQINQNAS